jgi:hypothetical protein
MTQSKIPVETHNTLKTQISKYCKEEDIPLGTFRLLMVAHWYLFCAGGTFVSAFMFKCACSGVQ